jgi:hypothetical protein
VLGDGETTILLTRTDVDCRARTGSGDINSSANLEFDPEIVPDTIPGTGFLAAPLQAHLNLTTTLPFA